MKDDKPLRLPCGGIAYYDDGSGISHRCIICDATFGSIGMPQSCKDEASKWANWKKLGGVGWDYFHGRPETTSEKEARRLRNASSDFG